MYVYVCIYIYIYIYMYIHTSTKCLTEGARHPATERCDMVLHQACRARSVNRRCSGKSKHIEHT